MAIAVVGLLDRWSVEEGIEVGHTNWDVPDENRLKYEAALRRGRPLPPPPRRRRHSPTQPDGGVVTAVRLADPGMLGGADRHPRALMAAVQSRSAPLELRPDDVELKISVDARFVAE